MLQYLSNKKVYISKLLQLKKNLFSFDHFFFQFFMGNGPTPMLFTGTGCNW